MATIGTYNEEGVNVDLYIPRKCHASNTLIPSFDHGSIQIAIGDIDSNGVYIAGSARTLCIAGFLRSQGASDHAINHLCIEHGVIRGRTGRQTKASKKKQADAKKRFAGKRTKPQAKKGGKPGQRGGRPQGARPDGKRGPRPEGKRAPRPEGAARPEGKRGPRPEGAARGPRPEGKRGPRPAPKTAAQ